MLVPSMTNKELFKEISTDYDTIYGSTTIDRIAKEYYRERIKRKISKEAVYTRFFDIKTKSKNNWIIRIGKDNLIGKYQNPGDSEIVTFAYYHSDKGIRVFSYDVHGVMVVFNRHLFQRYKERMNLDIPNFLDLVKCFLKNNFAVNYNLLPAEVDDSRKFFGLLTEGFIMGELIEKDHMFVNKTFISKSTANFAANSFETEFLKSMEERIMKIDKEKDYPLYYEMMKIYRTLMP